jgi:hypothetical protein
VNKSAKIFGIAAILVLVVGASIFWALHKPSQTNSIKTNTLPVAAVSTPTPTVIPATPTSSSKFSPEVRAKARSEFIASCKAKEGQQYTAACECGADYLAAHYTDTQLEKAYIAYHFGNTIPSEVRAAYDACKNK